MIFADIALPLPLPLFTYSIPEELKNYISPGVRVLVPFRNKKLVGFIVKIREEPPNETIEVKNILFILDKKTVIDKNLLKLAEWISSYYFSSLGLTLRYFVSPQKPVNIKKYYYSGELGKNTELSLQANELLEIIKSNNGIEINELKSKFNVKNISSLINKLIDKKFIYVLCSTGFRSFSSNTESFSDFREEIESPFILTDEQSKCLKFIEQHSNQFGVVLIHGITGSGKTEVYLQAISRTIAFSKQAIVMVPEIALTPQTIARFKRRFGENNIAVLHSRLGEKKRLSEWWRIKNGEVKVVIGARSAVFAPLPDVGIIVIDEEHETSYKQDESPRYHARDAAIMRAKFCNAQVILGTATPSLESYYNVSLGKYKLFCLNKRVKKSFLPEMEIVDMRDEVSKGNLNAFSESLISGMKDSLIKKEQIIIFQNRRGFSSFILCRKCGRSLKCKNCEVSLTYYLSRKRICCHYCGYTESVPDICPLCGSEYLENFGIGTEQIEDSIKKMFPDKRVARLDLNVSVKKGELERILEDFRQHKLDIMIGTQIIAKGHDFPQVTLVGIIMADITLNLPDFRASERTFQLLTQVAGRAGRGSLPGKVIIQTYDPSHYSIKWACQHNYRNFYEEEIKYRRALLYPPFTFLVNILFRSKSLEHCLSASRKFSKIFDRFKLKDMQLLGPAPAPIPKINNYNRIQIILKGYNRTSLHNCLFKTYQEYMNENKILNTVKVLFDIDPQEMI
ncbi:MAG: primosomal protein N' [Candidatus Firestonebacteria bacterium]|nr:primosomal protein N' [Candidatus Firestonebacteria bacterium]